MMSACGNKLSCYIKTVKLNITKVLGNTSMFNYLEAYNLVAYIQYT